MNIRIKAGGWQRPGTRVGCMLGLMCFVFMASLAQQRAYYQEPAWKPRAILPYADAINNDFWPASPRVNANYNDPGFDESRLAAVPAPGIHPRVLVTASDVDRIREKLALGDKAPLAFKVMWERVAKTQSPFYALVTHNDTLGRKLAIELVNKIRLLEPKLDEMDKRPDRDNLWNVERSIVADGDPDPPSEIWDLLQYDYLHRWMNAAEREMARSVIARIVNKRISNFLHVPDHFMINNHEGFGMEYIRLMLLIEGEAGFDQKLFEASAHKVNAMLDWFLDKDGMCYESIKGWLNISAFTAVGLRHRELLKHSHLQAKMQFFLSALRWEDGAWHIRDEMRASAFHVIWMMHYYHPNDEAIDFLYQSTFSTHPFLTNAAEKWPDPVGICQELLLLYADNGMTGKDGKPVDWTNQARIDKLHLPLTWHDSARGYVDVRNSWRKDDLHVGFVCKQDFFYGGHEGSENNRITLWKDGVNWIQDNNLLAAKATFLQNMLTVDGMGQRWPPAPGNWLGIQDSKDGLVAAGDGRIGYSYSKIMQVHPLAFPSAKTPYLAPFAEGNYDLSRDIQVAFQPGTIQYNDGYAHTDYGPWSGETRLVEGYKPFNMMQQAYRTVQVAKGKYPYVLIMDDAKKDENLHHFDFNLSIPMDAELVEVSTPEVVFQNTEPALTRVDDLVLGKAGTPKDPKTGKYLLKKGDPLCLIRVLWRNTAYGFPVPRLEKFQGYSLITIPALAVSPEFRVLVYPYKYGDPLPQTTWNKERTSLTVEIKEQKDRYSFAQTDGGRTVLSMVRNDAAALTSMAKPAKPVLIVRHATYDASEFRYTRLEQHTPTYLIQDSLEVQFKHPVAPAQIRYTTDGSEPNSNSPRFTRPIVLKRGCTLKARTFHPAWEQGPQAGDVLAANFVVKAPAPGLAKPSASWGSGLLVNVYEINTKLYNDKGFFEASRVMMPDVSKYSAIHTSAVSNISLPLVTPKAPMAEQSKGFYQFRGFFLANEAGVYTFDVYSCGPVILDIAGQEVIASTGVFHQQLDHRKGEVVLGKGWHALNLVVCDPLFWNINSLEPMPLTASYALNGHGFRAIAAAELMFDNESEKIKPQVYEPRWLDAAAEPPLLEPGLMLRVFDRTGKRREPDLLDIDNAQPIFSGQAGSIDASTSRNTIKVYDGYFYAPESGTYQFMMPYRVGDNAWLGSIQASCQSQLRINGEVVLQRGVYGRNLPGVVNLKEGWHFVSWRLGTGLAECKVLLPDGQTIELSGGNLMRPSMVAVLPGGKKTDKNLFEIYGPTEVALKFAPASDAQIRYTLDGRLPAVNSPLYGGKLMLSKSTRLTAVAFKNGQAISAPAAMEFKLVQVPEDGSLGLVQFDKWNGKSRLYPVNAGYKVWIAPEARLIGGLHGKALEMQKKEASTLYVDINVSRSGGPRAGFKLHQIKMRENALTVGLWFRTNDINGKLFGKDGINAFGKSYRTFSCSIANGKLQAMPGRLTGGDITPGVWYYMVLTADENRMDLYLNGERIASGAGTKDLATDALDFFTGNAAACQSVQLFDRLLEPDEVKRLYEWGRK